MNVMRESWTDERLDDLSNRVDRGFDRVGADIRTLRSEMKAGFDRMEERFDERFDGLHRLLLQFCWLMIATLLGLVVPLIGLVATKL
jgi:hypothetical protein